MAEHGVPLLRPDWPAPAHVRAAVSTREGGVSPGPYASLNLGAAAGDDPANVAENRRRLRAALGLATEPCWLRQVHGTTVANLDSDSRATGPVIEADASFTTVPDRVCVVMAADCLPVLFCDDAGTVVAAAHAGWRGLAAGVIEATLDALPADRRSLMAWLGPAIGPGAFEVGKDVVAAFNGPGEGECLRPLGSGKYLADLFGLARVRLARAGVSWVFGGGICTYEDRARFYSHRRDGTCGRMAALIWLDAPPQRERPSK